MFENVIKAATKKDIKYTVMDFKSGYFYNGKDNGYIYPVFAIGYETIPDKNLDNKNFMNYLSFVDIIRKRYKLIDFDKCITAQKCYHVFRTQEDDLIAREAYSKAVCFQEGFFMKRYNNASATQEELIAAGNENLIKHGYII